ncbi:MAG: galactosyldiacylglycerol synthase [Gemmatimonadota bacterium]
MPMQLLQSGTARVLGTITDAQFEMLAGELEEESAEDKDYYIDSDTVDMLAEDGIDPDLVTVLRTALAGGEGIEITWKRV